MIMLYCVQLRYRHTAISLVNLCFIKQSLSEGNKGKDYQYDFIESVEEFKQHQAEVLRTRTQIKVDTHICRY